MFFQGCLVGNVFVFSRAEFQMQVHLNGRASPAEAGVPAVAEEHRPGDRPVGCTGHDIVKGLRGFGRF